MNDNLLKLIDLVISSLTYLIAAISLILTLRQVRANTETTKATFWLNLRSMFQNYNNIHRSLQKDSSWRDANRKVSEEEALDIIGYMGMLEHCHKMLKRKLIDLNTFKDIYAYRVYLILNCPAIVNHTLVENGRYWMTFRELAEELGHKVPDRRDLNLDHKDIGYPAGWGIAQARLERPTESSSGVKNNKGKKGLGVKKRR